MENFEQNETELTAPVAEEPQMCCEAQELAAEAEPVKKKKKKGGKGAIAITLVCLLILGSCTITAGGISLYWHRENELLNQVMSNKIAALEDRLQQKLENVGSVEAAPTEGMTPAQVYNENVKAVVAVASDSSMGSGFIISQDGYVITNYHVVQNGKNLHVVMTDSKQYEVELIGYESSNDVALLKIKDGEGLPFVEIGSSDVLAVGEQVAAIGNPLGELTSTLTVGYVSAKDRVVTTEGTAMNMLQTDAAINSGNSGGPLFNMRGQVVGITTAKYSGNSTSGATIEGIGFAIPIDDVKGIIEDLKKYGYVTGAYMGITVRDVEEAVIQGYGFPAGAYVDSVTKGLAADKAGIRAKDIIINLGGYNVTSVSELTRVLRKFEAGQTTTVTVFRSGAEVNLSITLDEKPRQEQTQQPQQNQQGSNSYPDQFWNPFFG